MTDETRPDWLDENGMIIYDGRIPGDVKILDDDTNAVVIPFIIAALPYIGIALKLALLGLAIYSVVTRPSIGGGSLEAQRGFGFQFQNSRAPTVPLAVIYGEHKFAPHLWYNELSNQGNDNLLDLMWGIGEGPIEAVTDIRVNDIDFSTVDGSNSIDIHLADTFEKDSRLTKAGVSQDFSDTIEPNDEVIRTTLNEDVNEILVGVLYPRGLFKLDDTKGPRHVTNSLSIEYRKTSVGGSWTVAEQPNVSAKHSGELRKSFRIRGLDPDQYDVRVRNLSGPADEFKVIREVQLDFITEFIPRDFNVQDFAYLGMSLQATSTVQGGVPKTTCIVEGRKVKVIKTFSPRIEVTEWSDNPAWILRDFLTNAQYGVGRLFDDSNLDLASFFDVAQYCDEIDSNGNRRGQLDLVIDRVQPVVDILNIILTSFGGILRRDGNKLSLTVDRDEASTQNFNMGNILEGSFSFEIAGINRTTAINRINIAYFNRDKDYIRDVKRLEATSEITNEADVREINLDLPGVTREANVEALGRVLFNQLRTNITSVEFSSDISAVQALPGDVVSISHELPGWTNKKFRIFKVEEDEDQTRKITAVEHNASVYNEQGIVTIPVEDTNLWNPLSAATLISSVTLDQFDRRQTDGTIIQDMLVSWTTVTGVNTIFRVDHFEVYSQVASGTLLASGTPFNAADADSLFFVKDDGTLVSGTAFTPFVLEGTTKPPEQSFLIPNVSPNDFYQIAVIDITNNFTTIDLANAVFESRFITEYGEEPANTTFFDARFVEGTVALNWSPVSSVNEPDLAGYEIRDENADFGVDNSNLIFRGNATRFILEDVDFRSKDFFIKTFNTSGNYSQTVRSATASNQAPLAITALQPVVLGKNVRIEWSISTEDDVIGYRVHVSDTGSFTPNDTNLFTEVVGRTTASVIYTEMDDSFPQRFVRIAAIDSLSKKLEDYNYSSEKSFTAQDESSLVNQTSINLINDSDFNGISPGYWVGAGPTAFLSGSLGRLRGPNASLTQSIPAPQNRIQSNSPMVLSVGAFKTTGAAPNADILVRLTDGGSYNKVLTVPGSSLTTAEQRFSVSLDSGAVPTNLNVVVETDIDNQQVRVDHIMLQMGSGLTQWVPHSLELIEGYTDWLGQTELSDNAVVTSKIAANAIAAEKIASGAIETRHLTADLIESQHISTNTILADMYQELRQTFIYSFDGDLDANETLDVLFQIPSELRDIVSIKLSYDTRPFRATAKNVASGGASIVTTNSAPLGQHTHQLTISNQSFGSSQWIFKRSGNWLAIGGGGGTINTTTSQGHRHSWVIGNTTGNIALQFDKIFLKWPQNTNPLPTDIVGLTNAGDTILTSTVTSAGGTHSHSFFVPHNSLVGSAPSNEKVIRSGSSLRLTGNGGSHTLTSSPGPNGHTHTVNIPDHTHPIGFGIFEDNDTATTISIRRSFDGSLFETSNFSNSNSVSVLDQDLNPDGFLNGAGFKVLRFFSTGANGGRRHISGHIQLKIDIDA